MTQPIIELHQVTKRYADNTILSNINLTLESGKFYTLLGPSGCGKTTILRTIAGFTDATTGDILFAGKLINDVPANAQRQYGLSRLRPSSAHDCRRKFFDSPCRTAQIRNCRTG